MVDWETECRAAWDQMGRLSAEVIALKFSIKLITGFVPIDTPKFIEMLEAYGVEIEKEESNPS